jgi:predicted HTH domain antitoxin
MTKTDQPFKRLIILIGREFAAWVLNMDVRSVKLLSSEHTACTRQKNARKSVPAHSGGVSQFFDEVEKLRNPTPKGSVREPGSLTHPQVTSVDGNGGVVSVFRKEDSMSIVISDEIVAATQLSADEFLQEVAVLFYQQERLTLHQATVLAKTDKLLFQRLLASRSIALRDEEQDRATASETPRNLENIAEADMTDYLSNLEAYEEQLARGEITW